MIKLTNKLAMKSIIAVGVGLLFASAFTSTQGPCVTTIPGEDIRQCVEWSKVIMRPSDLLSNKQNSLVRYSGTLLIVSAGSYVLLSIYGRYQINRPR